MNMNSASTETLKKLQWFNEKLRILNEENHLCEGDYLEMSNILHGYFKMLQKKEKRKREESSTDDHFERMQLAMQLFRQSLEERVRETSAHVEHAQSTLVAEPGEARAVQA